MVPARLRRRVPTGPRPRPAPTVYACLQRSPEHAWLWKPDAPRRSHRDHLPFIQAQIRPTQGLFHRATCCPAGSGAADDFLYPPSVSTSRSGKPNATTGADLMLFGGPLTGNSRLLLTRPLTTKGAWPMPSPNWSGAGPNAFDNGTELAITNSTTWVPRPSSATPAPPGEGGAANGRLPTCPSCPQTTSPGTQAYNHTPRKWGYLTPVEILSKRLEM